MQTMPGSRITPKHERALPWDYRYAALLAKLQGLKADRSFATCTVHPNPAYPCFSTILDHGIGDFRSRHQQCSRSRRLNVLHSSEAASPEYFGRMGIDRNHIVPAATQFFEQRYAEVSGLPRDSHHRHAFLSKEVLNRFQ
jgi:hypothetical protein